MNWSIDDSRELYNITHWSDGYFDVNEAGELIAKPDPDQPGHQVSLLNLVHQAQALGMPTPLLVRFNDILHDRVDRLCGAFSNARTRFGFDGQYRAVYPIKVNQQHDVVEQLLLHGGQERFGLEAGSKPELMAVIGLAKPGSVIVCNGYKDREYIRTALIAEHLGHEVYIVVEKMSEMTLVLDEAEKMGVNPRMGVRVRLASQGKGKWQSSGGEKSKFGLSPTQILNLVETLRSRNKLGALQLVHYHLGSQLANIRDIQHALREAARYFAELHALGAAIQWVDVGGGLGVDYEGTTSSQSTCSTNYSMQEYANKVVSALADICAEHNIKHPNIISESGRAMTAHHAVLITDVIGVEETVGYKLPQPVEDHEAAILQDLWQGFKNISRRTALEIYHDAVYAIGEAHSLYVHGALSLQEWARASEIYAASCVKVRDTLQNNPGVHADILDELNEKLADKVFCNFSLFQSLPDAWAIGQIFPVLPLHYLDRKPERRGILQDITCDSDGKLDKYVEGEGIEPTMPMPKVDEDKPLYLGMFMVGAYQEILGDLHNLFGDTHSMHVEFKPDGSYEILNPLMGDTVADMLSCVDFDVDQIISVYRDKLAASNLPASIQAGYLAELETGMTGYSYLEE